MVLSTVASRLLFYNASSFDGNDPAANAADDAAIAPDKSAYIAGPGAASFSNVSGYVHGINGVMVDLTAGGNHAAITAADFSFRVGNNDTPGSWSAAPAPASVVVRSGAGAGGSDRVSITWANNVKGQWLEVRVLPTANTGLASTDVFYFGSAPGESGTGNSPTGMPVNATDEIGTLNNSHNFGNPALIDDAYDYNRDRFVNATDQLIVRNNTTNFMTQLRMFAAVAVPPPSLRAALSRDPGADGVTRDPVVAGMLTTSDTIVSFLAGLNGGPVTTDVLPLVRTGTNVTIMDRFSLPNRGQGYTTDGIYHYTTDNTTLYKYDRAAPGTWIDRQYSMFMSGQNHNGGITHYNGLIYVVAEGNVGPSATNKGLGWFRADTLDLVGFVALPEPDEVSSVTISPEKNRIYVTSYFTSNKMWEYDLGSKQYVGEIPLGDVRKIQGVSWRSPYWYFHTNDENLYRMHEDRLGTKEHVAYLYPHYVSGSPHGSDIEFSAFNVGADELHIETSDTSGNPFYVVRLDAGAFTISATVMDSMHGGPLPDGQHVLRLHAEDSLGQVSTVAVQFTLARSTANPQAAVSAGDGDSLADLARDPTAGNPLDGPYFRQLFGAEANDLTTDDSTRAVPPDAQGSSSTEVAKADSLDSNADPHEPSLRTPKREEGKPSAQPAVFAVGPDASYRRLPVKPRDRVRTFERIDPSPEARPEPLDAGPTAA